MSDNQTCNCCNSTLPPHQWFTCQQCDQKIKALNDTGECAIPSMPKAHCQCAACEAERLAERKEHERKAREQEKADRIEQAKQEAIDITPSLFQRTEISHPEFNRQRWEAVAIWRPTDKKPWLGLVGTTGECKSRIAYLALAEIAANLAGEDERQGMFYRVSVFATTATELAQAVLQTFSHDRDAQRRACKIIAEAKKATVLLLDDAGKERPTPAVATEFFEIIDHRYRQMLPTIWTANQMPDEFAAAWPEDKAAPYAGRFNSHSIIYKFP